MIKKTYLIIFFLSILLSAAAFLILFYLDDTLSSRQYITEGIFVSRTVFDKGQPNMKDGPERFFTFRLSDGRLINIKEPPLPMIQKSEYKLGDKANIYYRKGFFSKRIIYDSFYFK